MQKRITSVNNIIKPQTSIKGYLHNGRKELSRTGQKKAQQYNMELARE